METKKFYAFARKLVAIIFKIFYRYKIINRDNVPKSGRVLICSNHMQYKDPVLLGIIQRRQISFMAKKELFEKFGLGMLLRGLGVFPVERAGGIGALKTATRILKQDGIVGLFIEGKRSKTGELLPPKSGAVLLASKTDSPVVPVAIACRNGKPPRLFKKIYVNVGKPIQTKDLNLEGSTKADMDAASHQIMKEIKKLRDEIVNAEV